MESDLLKRLNLIKYEKDLTYSEIAVALGVTSDTATNYLTGRTKFPIPKLVVFAEKYGIDVKWLMTGEGGDQGLEVHDRGVEYKKAEAGRPAPFNHEGKIRALLAGLTDGFQSGQYELFEVEGASMEPTLHPGDRLLCRMVTKEEIIDTRIYVIVAARKDLREYRQSGTWVKRLQYRRDKGYVNCRSDNMDTAEPFPTFRLKAAELAEVWDPVLRITWHMADPNRGVHERIDELESRIEALEDQIGDD